MSKGGGGGGLMLSALRMEDKDRIGLSHVQSLFYFFSLPSNSVPPLPRVFLISSSARSTYHVPPAQHVCVAKIPFL